MERTLLLIKPDGVERKLIGEVIQRLEKRGWALVGMKLMKISKDLAEKHYAEHNGKPFFGELIDYITSGPVVAMAWEGEGIVAALRLMMGETNSIKAAPGTLRGDLANSFTKNLVHGSDSPESAQRELALFFNENELIA